MPRASWRGFLRLSLVSCPIYLSPATVVRPRHARRDAGVDQVGPSEQINEAVAGSKVDPRLPFRFGHVRKGHFCNGHARFLHRCEFGDRAQPPGAHVKPGVLSVELAGLADPSWRRADLCVRPALGSAGTHRRDRLQVASHSIRPLALTAQILHAGTDRRKVVGSAGFGHVSSPSAWSVFGGQWIACEPPRQERS
jgi:hypothetical protein